MNLEDLLQRLKELNIGPEDYHRYEIKLSADGDWFPDIECRRVDKRPVVVLSSPDLDDNLYDERNGL